MKKTTSKETDYYYGYTGLTAYSSGGAWGVSSPIPLVANHTYSMTVDPFAVGCGYTILSSYPRLGVGTSLTNAKTSYQNNTNVNEKFYQAVSNSRYLQYVFTPSINATHIVFPFATTSTCSTNEVQLSSIVIEDLGESSVTQDQINTSLTNQTTEINNSIQNSTNTITGEIDDMEQNIIDSNNENTDKIIEANKVCKDYNYTYDNIQKYDGYLGSSNTIIDGGTSYKHTDYIPLNKNENYELTINFTNNNLNYCTYKKDKTLISCQKYNSQSFTINLSEDGYIRYSTRLNYEVNFNGKYCQNGNQEVSDNLNDIKDTLTDSSAPDTSGLENSVGWLPQGPLDSILNLPLTMLNSLTNSLNKTCQPLNIELPYVNKNIQIPCLSAIFAQITGVSTFWTWVGTIASVLILYNYLLNLYAWVDRVLTLRLEVPEAMGADLKNWGDY